MVGLEAFSCPTLREDTRAHRHHRGRILVNGGASVFGWWARPWPTTSRIASNTCA